MFALFSVGFAKRYIVIFIVKCLKIVARLIGNGHGKAI